jgi:hypothetical protein
MIKNSHFLRLRIMPILWRVFRTLWYAVHVPQGSLKNEDIIKVHKYKLVEVFDKYEVNSTLVSHDAISEAEWKHVPVIMTVPCGECCLELGLCIERNLPIFGLHI